MTDAIAAIAVLAIAYVLLANHFMRRIAKLERDLDDAWWWARFYKVLAWRWHDRATIASGLEPYWDWAEEGAYPVADGRQEGEPNQ